MPRFCLVLLSGLVFLAPVRGQAQDRKQAAVAYLQKLQATDGGFLPAQPAPGEEGKAKSSLRAMSSALRALKYFGGEPRMRDACSGFVGSCQDKDTGGFADQPGGEPNVAVTAVGLMAAVELKAPVERIQDRAVQFLLQRAKSFEDIRIAAAGLEAIGAR